MPHSSAGPTDTTSKRLEPGAWMVAATCLCLSALASSACAAPRVTPHLPAASVEDRLNNAIDALDDVEEHIPPTLVRQTRCVAVVPAVASGTAPSGGGFAACRAGTTWGSPAPIVLVGQSAGGRAMTDDLILLVMTDGAMQRLLGEGVRLGASATAAAGPVGSNDGGKAPRADILCYVRTHGVLVGAELGELTIAQDRDSTRRLYGGEEDFGHLLGAVR